MSTVTFKGNTVKLSGDIPTQGKAPNFSYVKSDLSESSLYEHGDKVKVIIAVPSLDTGICQKEAREFNKRLAERENVRGIVISKDLPFAMKRFCELEGIDQVESASDFRSNFTELYNISMEEGPLRGLSARAVLW